jgi:Berberine and berberine like
MSLERPSNREPLPVASRLCEEVQDYWVKDAGFLIAHEVRDGRDDPQAAGGDTALVANLAEGRAPGQSRELDFTPWAGAYNRIEEDATAFAHRGELFSLKHAVTVDADAATAEKEAAKRWVTRSWSSVRPWGSGRVFPNFPDPDLPDSGPAYYGTNYEWLLRVKRRYDPDNVFCFHQSLPTGSR